MNEKTYKIIDFIDERHAKVVKHVKAVASMHFGRRDTRYFNKKTPNDGRFNLNTKKPSTNLVIGLHFDTQLNLYTNLGKAYHQKWPID